MVGALCACTNLADGAHFFWPHVAIVAQLPSVAVPIALNRRSGLPRAVQLVGAAGRDEAAVSQLMLTPMWLRWLAWLPSCGGWGPQRSKNIEMFWFRKAPAGFTQSPAGGPKRLHRPFSTSR